MKHSLYPVGTSAKALANRLRRLKSDLADLCSRANASKDRYEISELVSRADKIRSELVDNGELPESSR